MNVRHQDSASLSEPSDPVFDTLKNAVSGVLALDCSETKAAAFAHALSEIVASLGLPDQQRENAAQTSRDPSTAPLAAQQQLSIAQTEAAFQEVEVASASQLQAAIEAWDLARMTYSTGQSAAKNALSSTAKEAGDAYSSNLAGDNIRNQHLHALMMGTVQAALASYVDTLSRLGKVLAEAAGVLLAAYASYAGSTLTANAAKLSTDAQTVQTYWAALEASQDSA